MATTKTKFRLFYREVKRPDNMGEGAPVTKPETAQTICDWHNKACPRYLHWFEKDEDPK